MSVNLRSGLTAGAYTVTFRTFDDNDNAIFGDCYVFFVGQTAADAAIAAKARLDGGGSCQRIDASAKAGTPVAGGTPQAGAASTHEDDAEAASTTSGKDGGVPIWGLVLGVVVGVVVGGAGGKFLGSRN